MRRDDSWGLGLRRHPSGRVEINTPGPSIRWDSDRFLCSQFQGVVYEKRRIVQPRFDNSPHLLLLGLLGLMNRVGFEGKEWLCGGGCRGPLVGRAGVNFWRAGGVSPLSPFARARRGRFAFWRSLCVSPLSLVCCAGERGVLSLCLFDLARDDPVFAIASPPLMMRLVRSLIVCFDRPINFV